MYGYNLTWEAGMSSIRLTVNDRSIDIEIQRKKMKTVRLKIHTDGRVVLSAPYAISDRWLRQYAASKSAWIGKHLGSIPGTMAPDTAVDGGGLSILGQRVTVRVIPSSRPGITLDGPVLYIRSPQPGSPEALDRQLDRWWRARATEAFAASLVRLYPIVSAHGVAFPQLSVRRMKTLWGSCSIHRGVVTLNYYLYRAAPACIDFIVLHELTHFLYRHHDRDFYAFLSRHMPDWKERKKALRMQDAGRTFETDRE